MGMAQPHKNLCETHIIGPGCRERFLPGEGAAVLPLRLLDVSLAGFSQLNGNYHISRIRPNFHAVIYTVDGSGTLIHCGGSYRMTRGNLTILPVGSIYEYRTTQRRWTICWWHLQNSPQWASLMDPGIVLRPGNHGGSLVASFDGLILETGPGLDSDPVARRAADLWGQVAALSIQREMATPIHSDSGAQHLRLNPVWNTVDSALQEPWSTARMARLAHVTPGHFFRLVRQIHGCTPGQMLTKLRMARARQLLGRTDMRISEVAVAVGYSDAFAFSAACKRVLGISPSRIRNP